VENQEDSYHGHMKRVKIADLKNNLSRYLSHVREGGDLIVLDRHTPVARIVPFDRPAPAEAPGTGREEYWTEARVGEMERRGTIARGERGTMAAWLKETRTTKLPAGTPSAVDLLLRARRETAR
jgi:prevent-host-death family protein